ELSFALRPAYPPLSPELNLLNPLGRQEQIPNPKNQIPIEICLGIGSWMSRFVARGSPHRYIQIHETILRNALIPSRIRRNRSPSGSPFRQLQSHGAVEHSQGRARRRERLGANGPARNAGRDRRDSRTIGIVG